MQMRIQNREMLRFSFFGHKTKQNHQECSCSICEIGDFVENL